MQNVFWLSAFDGKMGSTNETLLQYSNSFWLKNVNSQNKEKSVVICLHGWTATTYESKPIGDAIFQSGIDSAGPLLPGHGFKENSVAKKELSKIKYTDWISAVSHEIKQARKKYKKVFIYGQSMGGALALYAASEGIVDGDETQRDVDEIDGAGVKGGDEIEAGDEIKKEEFSEVNEENGEEKGLEEPKIKED